MLFYVMVPDNVESQWPTFTRYGRMMKCRRTALATGERLSGRVYSVDGATSLVKDFWVQPELKLVDGRTYRQQRAEVALFGRTV